jgi:hypothetical protein
MVTTLKPCDGAVVASLFSLRRKCRMTPAYDCKAAFVADIVEPSPGEYYIMLGEGNHDCERWRLTEDIARKLRRALNARLD